MVDPLKRPDRPEQSKPNSAATQRPASIKQRKVIPTVNRGGSGGGRYRGGSGGGGYGGNQPPEGQPDETSPWLIQPEFEPDESASFVEYLRWMRSPGNSYENSAKLQIMQLAETRNYEKRLQQLTKRTRKIAQIHNGSIFLAECPWRIRVGGHRGPESILLPAFDATGMPYIPSSTLRGVARTQAILEKLPQDLDKSNKVAFEDAWKQADLEVAKWFGHLEASQKSDCACKVIFLDAYPLPEKSGQLGGLATDMANNVWSWKNNGMPPEYKPNPNALFSLKGAVFQIGLCPVSSSEEDLAACKQIRRWLESGLQAGIGSQVNSGYGRLSVENVQSDSSQDLLAIRFSLKGQLIHGQQEFRDLKRPYKWDQKINDYKVKGRNQEFEADTIPAPEVRPTAFKSMLRYWFRTLSLGVLPIKDVEEKWEPILFGAIQPQIQGWIEFQIKDSSDPDAKVQEKGKPCLEQSGLLKLSYSLAAPQTQEKRKLAKQLFEHLIWLMFHLGGVGQGARRPLYCRENRHSPRPPWYRGTELKAKYGDLFQEPPKDFEEFRIIFQSHLQSFYEALKLLTEHHIAIPKKITNRPIRRAQWQDVADINCEIVVCSGSGENGKPFALAVLHSDDLKIPKIKNGRKILENGREVLEYDPDLCGKTSDRSPIWVKDLGVYQVVTVFGASQDPRKRYLEELKRQARGRYAQIFPFQ
ncbi:MAG: type III-B CRISPR module RAMP protein Cmr6 [Leptolyngbyaceae cyanobacterium SM2_5_2]|nr:type III-B CRISPR module RAMP protein Cmr6 [Leptolyngbyaceae cyanobacterium SM2_5_2]